MKVRVYRNSGDNEYPEILVDELCVTEQVGIQKGKCFLYDNGFDKLVYDVQTNLNKQLNPNDIAFIDDSSIGESFYGRITGININCIRNDGALDITQTLNIKRYIDE